MAGVLEPFHQQRDLGRTSRAVRAFNHDQFSREHFEIDLRDAVSIEAPLAAPWDNDHVFGRALHSTASSSGLMGGVCLAAALVLSVSLGRSARRNCSRTTRRLTISRTRLCWVSMS